MYSSKFIFSDEFKKLGLKIGMIDAGARENLPDPWKYMDPSLMDIIGFEPDPSECLRLQKAYPGRKYFAYALWSKKARVPIHINKTPSTSSVFPVNGQVTGDFDSHHIQGRILDKAIEVDAVALDDVIGRDWQFDFFKIDTQGSERLILEGAKLNLSLHKPIVIAEAWNVDAYQGAPSAGEIIRYMESLGYFVLDMEITANWLYQNSAHSWLASRDRATGVDLVFFPKLESLKTLNNEILLKRVAILELFGYRDLAVCILEKHFNGNEDIRIQMVNQLKKNAKQESSLLKKLVRRWWLLRGKRKSPHAPIHD